MQYIIDAERIFGYCVLCFVRKEIPSLPGFEENEYVVNSNANQRKWHDLTTEFLIVRQSTQLLFESFTPEMLLLSGKANNNITNASSIGFIILGHFCHHKKMVKKIFVRITFNAILCHQSK